MQKIVTFLMFTGQAEEAVKYYTSLFENSSVVSMSHNPGEGGAHETVRHAVFRLCGQEFRCIDSPPMHAFSFTPSMSLFVEFSEASQLDEVFHALSKDGQVLMPLDRYPFSEHYAWITDKFGVSWQLSTA